MIRFFVRRPQRTNARAALCPVDFVQMSTLTPHGACLMWRPDLIWLNVVSDAAVAAAFFATALLLGYFVWRRHQHMLLMFRAVFWAYASFIAICGLVRLEEILTL